MSRRILPVFVPHLGCRADCVFCNQKKIAGAELPATADTVLAELERAPAFLRGAQLAFYGGSFTAIPAVEQEALLSAAQTFLARDPGNSLRVSTRPDAVSLAALERLRRFGVRTVELGIQSMDGEVLALSGRGYAPDCCYGAVRRLKSLGFEVILQMMTGLPGDTREKSLFTARELIRMAPDGVRIYPTVVIRDTPLEAMYLTGAYAPHTVGEAVSWCADIVPLFHRAGIPVIRLGLNPTEDLSGGEVAAGAYHPALGQLVYGELYYRAALPVLEKCRGRREVTLGVCARDISTVVGQHRANVQRLQAELEIGRIRVRGAEIPRFTVINLSEKQ